MRAAVIHILNFCGIQEIEIELGKQITELRGTNGVGKSSVLRALQALTGQRLDNEVPLAQLRRDGEKEARVGLLLSDGREFSRRWSPGGETELEGLGADRKPIKSPKAALREVLDSLVNPIAFLTATPDKRAGWLIEAAPLTVTSEELAEAVGNPDKGAYRHLQQVHALVAIERLSKEVSDARTQANVVIRDRTAALKQLEAQLPPDATGAEDWDGEVKRATDALGRAETALLNADRTAAGMLRDLSHAAEVKFRTAKAELVTDAEQRIAKIREQLAADIELARQEWDLTVSDGKADAERIVAQTKPKLQAARDQAQEALANARARRDAHVRAAGTRALITQLREEIDRAGGQYRACGKSLENLSNKKLGLLDRMPVQGLEIRLDGQIYRNGVLFDLLNDAQQVEVAIEIAQQRAGKCGLICVDGMEKLAPAKYKEFKRQAAASGLQFVIARPSDDPELRIITDEEALAS
jgi:hypothetical protein